MESFLVVLVVEFEKISEAVPFDEVVKMYSVYHEMDTGAFDEEMKRRVTMFRIEVRKTCQDNVLKRLRA